MILVEIIGFFCTRNVICTPRKFCFQTVGWLWYWDQTVIRLHLPPSTVHYCVNFRLVLPIIWRHRVRFEDHKEISQLESSHKILSCCLSNIVMKSRMMVQLKDVIILFLMMHLLILRRRQRLPLGKKQKIPKTMMVKGMPFEMQNSSQCTMLLLLWTLLRKMQK